MVNQLRFKDSKMVDNSCQGGYIALMSALIIAAILLVVSVSLGMGGFFTRFNAQNQEFKLSGEQLAQSCFERAKVLLALDPYIENTGSFSIDNNNCNIVSITEDYPEIKKTTIETSATVHNSTTNLKAVINSEDFSLVSVNYY